MQRGISKSLILAFFVSISTSMCAQDQPTTEQPATQKKYTFSVHPAQDEALRLKKAYIDILDELEASKIYWESVDFHPLRYLLAQSPLQWVTGKPRSKVKSKHLKNLDTLTTRITSQLGILHTALTNANKEHTEESYEVVRYLVEQELGECGSSSTYKKAFFKKHRAWLQPNHFVRNWVPYTLGAAAVMAASIYIYKNPGIVKTNIDKLKSYGENFWSDNISKPFQDMKRTFFEGNESAREMTQQEEYAAYQMNKQWLTDKYTKIYTASEIDEMAWKAARTGVLPQKFIEARIRLAKDPKWEMAVDSGGRTVAIDLQNDKNKVNRVLNKLDGVIVLLSLMPAYFVVNMCYSAGKAGYRILSPEKIVPLHIRKLLLSLQYHYNNTLHDTDTQDPYHVGVQAYHNYKLEHVSHFIPSGDRLQFKRDIEKLVSPTDSNQQKYNVIDIMLNRYEFLRV